MTHTSQIVESRIASLPLDSAQREEALAYVEAGEELAEILLAVRQLFSPPPGHNLSHTH